MDLYKYHSNPETLDRYAERDQIVPERIYEIAKSGKKLTQTQEAVLAKSSMYAYRYAFNVLGKRFPEGEAVIAKDADYAYYYARDMLKKSWPAGEAVIAKDAYYAYLYARKVLGKRFPKGEAAIASDAHYAYYYALYVLDLSEKEANKWGKR